MDMLRTQPFVLVREVVFSLRLLLLRVCIEGNVSIVLCREVVLFRNVSFIGGFTVERAPEHTYNSMFAIVRGFFLA